MSAMPQYLYSPNAAQKAQAALDCATKKLARCEARLHVCRSGSDRKEAMRSLRSAQRQVADAEAQLARVEDKRPHGVTL